MVLEFRTSTLTSALVEVWSHVIVIVLQLCTSTLTSALTSALSCIHLLSFGAQIDVRAEGSRLNQTN